MAARGSADESGFQPFQFRVRFHSRGVASGWDGAAPLALREKRMVDERPGCRSKKTESSGVEERQIPGSADPGIRGES